MSQKTFYTNLISLKLPEMKAISSEIYNKGLIRKEKKDKIRLVDNNSLISHIFVRRKKFGRGNSIKLLKTTLQHRRDHYYTADFLLATSKIHLNNPANNFLQKLKNLRRKKKAINILNNHKFNLLLKSKRNILPNKRSKIKSWFLHSTSHKSSSTTTSLANSSVTTATRGSSGRKSTMSAANRVTKFPTTEGSSGRKSTMSVANRSLKTRIRKVKRISNKFPLRILGKSRKGGFSAYGSGLKNFLPKRSVRFAINKAFLHFQKKTQFSPEKLKQFKNLKSIIPLRVTPGFLGKKIVVTPPAFRNNYSQVSMKIWKKTRASNGTKNVGISLTGIFLSTHKKKVKIKIKEPIVAVNATNSAYETLLSLIAEKKDLLRSKWPISPVKKYVPAQNNGHFNPIKAQQPFPKNEMKNASGRPSSTTMTEGSSGRKSTMSVANSSGTVHSVHRRPSSTTETRGSSSVTTHSAHHKPSFTAMNNVNRVTKFPTTEGSSSVTVHYADRKPSSTTTNNVNRVTKFPVNEMNSGRESKMNVANRVTKFPTTEGSSSGTVHSIHRRPSSTTETRGSSSSVTTHSAHHKPSFTAMNNVNSGRESTMNNVNRVTKFPTTEGSSGRKSTMSVANSSATVYSAHRRPSSTTTTGGSCVGKSTVNEMNSKSFFKVNETRPPVLNKSYEKANQRLLNNPVPRNVSNKSSKETKINTSVPSGHRRPSSTIHSVHRNNKNIITTEATLIVGVNAVHFVDRRPTMNGKKEVKNITNENNTKSNKETNRYFSNKLDTRKPTVFPVRNSNERKNWEKEEVNIHEEYHRQRRWKDKYNKQENSPINSKRKPDIKK